VDRRAKVELYEQIRREYEHGGGTIRGIARKLGIHRRMVREAVLSAVPVKRKTPERERPKLEPAMGLSKSNSLSRMVSRYIVRLLFVQRSECDYSVILGRTTRSRQMRVIKIARCQRHWCSL
jgi:hypothetical protein